MRINNSIQTSINNAESINNTSNKTKVETNTKLNTTKENKLETPENDSKTEKNGVLGEAKNTTDKLEKIVESMNEFIKSTNTSLQFNLHEELEQYYVQIIDSRTDEVIKEIPSEEMMDLHAKILQSIGVLVDKKI